MFPEIERFIIDLEQEMTGSNPNFGDQLRELFSDIYSSSAGSPDLIAAHDDLRWIARQTGFAAAARFRAMAATFSRRMAEATEMLEERG